MKPSFVTWQLRRLHVELAGLDKMRGRELSPTKSPVASGRNGSRDRAARQAMVDRMLRALPKRLGFRDARAFLQAFAHANELQPSTLHPRRKLSAAQVRELERRVLLNERPGAIAHTVGCAEQTVLNRASQLRKRLATLAEEDASGI